MKRRFYSHFTFIYPDTYLKNVIVEINNQNQIIDIFSFEKEIENTEFYSGWLCFLDDIDDLSSIDLINKESVLFFECESVLSDFKDRIFYIIDEEGICH